MLNESWRINIGEVSYKHVLQIKLEIYHNQRGISIELKINFNFRNKILISPRILNIRDRMLIAFKKLPLSLHVKFYIYKKIRELSRSAIWSFGAKFEIRIPSMFILRVSRCGISSRLHFIFVKHSFWHFITFATRYRWPRDSSERSRRITRKILSYFKNILEYVTCIGG